MTPITEGVQSHCYIRVITNKTKGQTKVFEIFRSGNVEQLTFGNVTAIPFTIVILFIANHCNDDIEMRFAQEHPARD